MKTLRKLPIKAETIDAQSGKVVKTEMVTAGILPPAATACPICGRNPAHPADQPHDAQSLYYQYSFFGEHGRWPTWKDAIAHCPEGVKQHWEAELRRLGAWTEPPPRRETGGTAR
ncbi:MAG: hypothetical protein IH626_22940 [Rhodospirillales bacterium]|nr:hypothetical protein [Rhodospirillales bacterium]